MNRIFFVSAAVAWMVLAAVWAVPAECASMGTSGGHDLDTLLSLSRRQFTLEANDAVLLVESRRVSITGEGDLRTAVHRVVWIGTPAGLREHADLRVPYNSDTSTLTVTALRTWRDDAWWPHETEVSATAVVETLPFELAQADDYTGMRETMLLHDGVELPCVMETAYEIVTRGAAGDGADGLWVFAQRDPAVRVDFTLTVPSDAPLSLHSGGGAPEPEATRGPDGSITYAWTMENAAPLGSPMVADPAVHAPYAAWSTWESWEALGRKIVSSFDGAAVLDGALADTIAARLAHEPSPAERARKVAAYVDESVRGVRYDPRFWAFSPRPAARTWETAYGHALDRAALAAALFRRAGFDAVPLYRSAAGSAIDSDVPGLCRFGSAGLRVSGDGLEAFYDPSDGTLDSAPGPLLGRVVWTPAENRLPAARGVGDTEAGSRFELFLVLEANEEGDWAGTGYMSAGGCFSPHGEMTGARGEAAAKLRKIVSSVLPGAASDAFSPEVFERECVSGGFAFTLKAPQDDDHGRKSLTIGEPAGGILSRLQPDVRLYHERRGSPVTVALGMTQKITLRLKSGGREVIRLPEARDIENGAGHFTLRAVDADGWVTIEREIGLRAGSVGPDAWPRLRELLLEETDAAGRTILLK